jgi:hypothetical protein
VPVIAILVAVTVTTILLPLNFAGGKTPKVHDPGNTSSCSSSSSTHSVASSSVSGSAGSCSTNSSSSSKTTTAGIITSGQSTVGLSSNSPRHSKLDQYCRWSIMLLIRYSRVKRSLVSHKQAAAHIFLFFQPNRVNSIRYDKNNQVEETSQYLPKK